MTYVQVGIYLKSLGALSSLIDVQFALNMSHNYVYIILDQVYVTGRAPYVHSYHRKTVTTTLLKYHIIYEYALQNLAYLQSWTYQERISVKGKQETV